MKLSAQTPTRLLYSLVLAALVALQANVALADSDSTKKLPVSKYTTTLQITAAGDSVLNVKYEVPKEKYTALKQKKSHAISLAKSMRNNFSKNVVRNLSSSHNDAKQTINASMTLVGFSKPYEESLWAIDLSSIHLKFDSLQDGVALFKKTSKNTTSIIQASVRVVLPIGSTQYKYNQSKKILTYKFIPQLPNKPGKIQFAVETKSKLMSALAKVYGDERFENYWVARSNFQNVGGQVIKDLRIRHRVSNLSVWSSWKKSNVVYPKQTVIEKFYPVLDIDKIAQFTEARTAMVEVEYQYTMNGKTYTDTNLRKIQILARNDVLWGSSPVTTSQNWYERFNNSKMIATAFSTSNDPVIQQVAGAVTRMAGGHPQTNDQGAILFLRTMWKFMEINKISYQSPAGSPLEGHFSQHVKYGRDVIRNRAGTCIDLAVLWASVAKAVGLKSYIVFVPGHAFPVIQLHSGKIVAIESTLINHESFDKAATQGLRNYRIATGQIKNDSKGKAIRNAGMNMIADISKIRGLGVHSLDLPKVVDGYLLKLGYKLNVVTKPKVEQTAEVKRTNTVQPTKHIIKQTSQVKPKPNKEQTPSTSTTPNVPNLQNAPTKQTKKPVDNQTASRPKNLQGTWVYVLDNLRIGIRIGANGEYEFLMQTYDDLGKLYSQNSLQGTWSTKGTVFSINTKDGVSSSNYQLQGDQLIIIIDGTQRIFTRKK